MVRLLTPPKDFSTSNDGPVQWLVAQPQRKLRGKMGERHIHTQTLFVGPHLTLGAAGKSYSVSNPVLDTTHTHTHLPCPLRLWLRRKLPTGELYPQCGTGQGCRALWNRVTFTLLTTWGTQMRELAIEWVAKDRPSKFTQLEGSRGKGWSGLMPTTSLWVCGPWRKVSDPWRISEHIWKWQQPCSQSPSVIPHSQV